MDERAALVAAVAANPDDDTPRLAFADWLQEHGEDDRAEFIRLQCGFQHSARVPDAPRRARRVAQLLTARWQEWFRPLFRALGAQEPRPPDGEPYQTPSAGTTRASISRPHSDALKDRIRFLDRLDIERGFVDTLVLYAHYRTRPCSFAGAFQWEPITQLQLWFSTVRTTGLDLLESALRQIRWLFLMPEGPGHPAADAFLSEFLGSDCWSGLTSLAFSNVSNRPTTPAEWIATAARQPWAGNLTSFSASLTDAGLRHLVASPGLARLETLGFHGSRLTVDAVSSLAGLRCRQAVKALDLSSSELTTEHTGALGSLTGWTALKELDLGFNPVGDAGALALTRSPLVRSLRRLRMSQCGLTEEGIGTLAGAVNPDRIESLEFNYNAITPEFEWSMRKRFGDKIELSMDL